MEQRNFAILHTIFTQELQSHALNRFIYMCRV